MLPIKIKHITLLFLMMLSGLCLAQSKSIQGKVTDTQGVPVDGAAVVLYNAKKSIITYTVTNEFGAYALEGDVKENYILEFTHISFLKQSKTITANQLTQSPIVIDVMLEENTASLDEVIIISTNEVKDTVRLDLDKLKLYEDDNLRDILNKIPNFRLSDDGTIIYKGKSIDKILVNKKPSFEYQNSIALESIEKNIIEGISVINNYNDDFSLDFEENEESVLNIDTKNQSQSIMNGSLELKAGYQDKYEFKGKGFLFSKNLNAFLTNNTNNIGKTTVTAGEVKKLFSEGQPFSRYQGETLSGLFATNENLLKDFYTSTNLTLRNQSQRLKTSGLFYFIAPDRVNSIVQNTSTLDNVSLLNTLDETQAKTTSFLGALSVAYKISNKTIATYNINANYINNKNNSDVRNELFDNGTPNGMNTTFANNRNNIFSSNHVLSVKSKLKKNLILETKAAYYHEGTKLLNDYTISQNNSIFDTATQRYRFDKNQVLGSVGLKYKASDQFISLISATYHKENEEIKDRNLNNTMLIKRSQDNFLVDVEVTGEDIVKGLDYEVSLGLNSFTNNLTVDQIEASETFIPVDLWVDYENRLNRYAVSYTRTRTFNDIVLGINSIQPFNSIWNGTNLFALGFNTSNNFHASYDYDNLFDGEIFSISATYKNQKDVVRRNFVSQANGISEFNFFIADKATDFKLSTFYSKTISPLKYPTKIDISASYNQVEYPAIIAQQEVDVVTKTIAPELRVETITDNFVNFSLSSKVSFSSDEIQNTTYDATYTRNSVAVLLKNKQWKGNITFLYDNNHINNVTYSRKNLNLGLSYTKNNMVFSMEARHIGELLSFFENDAYNSQFIISNGITNTIVNNQSLNYIIFGIKFKL
ncbi:carboxypeptidase-like regulatory domain-containing protein [Kordia jejudonensis]|uniref:carboxypeptidase-like regulatory domain-containing protein n=1 Tax=Kordia jejudonensis TaxID=1348245 RepID=UPI000628FFEA|nr:carboxypeptidase-like regulatory domain-containing protein [Kordia jejudonensis]